MSFLPLPSLAGGFFNIVDDRDVDSSNYLGIDARLDSTERAVDWQRAVNRPNFVGDCHRVIDFCPSVYIGFIRSYGDLLHTV